MSGTPVPPAAAGDGQSQPTEAHLAFELKAVTWLHNQVRTQGVLAVAESEAIVQALRVALARDGDAVIRLVPLRGMSEYVAVHALNSTLLALALAQHIGLEENAVDDVGMAALLHDIGMARVPVRVLAKSDPLTTEERDMIKQHPAEGARIILQADASLELPAVVAYEHHLRLDGSGYPELTFPRESHFGARLVQLCDVYHALHSPRPFRQSWPQDIIISFLRERAGFEFDSELAPAFAAMLQHRRVV